MGAGSSNHTFADSQDRPKQMCLSVLKNRHGLAGDVKINSCCPGWVRTRMGGPEAPRTPEQGADTPVWLATLPADGPSGGFFRERKRIPW